MTKKLLLQRGFTLVELLIVIALLGALAIGLIGALDPFEQLKKGTDAGTRNTVSEFHSAVIRYFALKGRMPWCADDACGDTSFLPDKVALDATTPQDMATVVTTIADSGELKSDFASIQSTQLGKVFVTGTASTLTVCYDPTSKSFSSDANTKYQIDGTAAGGQTGCTTASDPTLTCYWCVK